MLSITFIFIYISSDSYHSDSSRGSSVLSKSMSGGRGASIAEILSSSGKSTTLLEKSQVQEIPEMLEKKFRIGEGGSKI